MMIVSHSDSYKITHFNLVHYKNLSKIGLMSKFVIEVLKWINAVLIHES